MKCNYCGREILEDSKFCEFCGKAVIRSEGKKKKPSYGKYWLIAILIFAAITAFYAIIVIILLNV